MKLLVVIALVFATNAEDFFDNESALIGDPNFTFGSESNDPTRRALGSFDRSKTGVQRIYGGLDGRKKVSWTTSQGAATDVDNVPTHTCADVNRFLTMDKDSCRQAAKDLSDESYGTGCEWLFLEGASYSTWAETTHGPDHMAVLSEINHAKKPHGCLFLVVHGQYRKVKVYWNTANTFAAGYRLKTGTTGASGTLDMVYSDSSYTTPYPTCAFDNEHVAGTTASNGAKTWNPASGPGPNDANRKYEMKCLCIKCNRAYCNNNAPIPMFRAIPAVPIKPIDPATSTFRTPDYSTVTTHLGADIGFMQDTSFWYPKTYVTAKTMGSTGTNGEPDAVETYYTTTGGDKMLDIAMEGYRYQLYNEGQCSCDCWLQGNYFEHRCNYVVTQQTCRHQASANLPDATEKIHLYDNRVEERIITCDYWKVVTTDRKCFKYGPRDKRCSRDTCCSDMEFTTCAKYSESQLSATGSANRLAEDNASLAAFKRKEDAWCHAQGNTARPLQLADGAEELQCWQDLSSNDPTKAIQKDSCHKDRCCQDYTERARCSDLDHCSSVGCAYLAPGAYIDSPDNEDKGTWIMNKSSRYWDASRICTGDLCTPAECCVDPMEEILLQNTPAGQKYRELKLSQMIIKDDRGEKASTSKILHTIKLDNGQPPLVGGNANPAWKSMVQCRNDYERTSYWTCPPGRAQKTAVLLAAKLAKEKVDEVSQGLRFYDNKSARHMTYAVCNPPAAGYAFFNDASTWRDPGGTPPTGKEHIRHTEDLSVTVTVREIQVRCCQDDGLSAVTCHAGYSPSSGQACYSSLSAGGGKTYDEAKALCELTPNRRLCTEAELTTSICCDSNVAEVNDGSWNCPAGNEDGGTQNAQTNNKFWSSEMSTPDRETKVDVTASGAHYVTKAQLIGTLCDGTSQNCDDICCSRRQFCEILDLMSVVSVIKASKAANDEAFRESRASGRDADRAEQMNQQCQLKINHYNKLVEISNATPIITPVARPRPGKKFDFVMLVIAMAGMAIGAAVKYAGCF